jgi:thioredoxin-related protein
MKKLFSFILFACIATSFLNFAPKPKEKINWITMQQLNEQYAKNPKPILIDLYTSWCGWCKVMDSKTYTHEKLAKYVNEHYYAVKFDAESREVITFNNKTYKYNAQYKTNELALYLTSGQLSYPTTVFMSGVSAQPAPLPGYLKPKEIEGPLKYFGEKADVKETFVAFNKKLHTEW